MNKIILLGNGLAKIRYNYRIETVPADGEHSDWQARIYEGNIRSDFRPQPRVKTRERFDRVEIVKLDEEI